MDHLPKYIVVKKIQILKRLKPQPGYLFHPISNEVYEPIGDGFFTNFSKAETDSIQLSGTDLMYLH